MWQKLLLSLACFATCLPMDALASCCCTRAAGMKGLVDRICCSESEVTTCCSPAKTPSCCSSRLAHSDCGSEDSCERPVKCKCRCDCRPEVDAAIATKYTDVPVSIAAMAAHWSFPDNACVSNSHFSDSERPPIAHNRRQSLLCVWLN